jgi:hypothetical protein
MGNEAKNKSVISSLETIWNAAGVVGGVLGGISDVVRLAQDPNSSPLYYVGLGVKAAKNPNDKIPDLGNIIHITDFALMVLIML